MRVITRILIVATVVASACAASSKTKNPTEFFTLCRRNDPDLGGCVRRSVEAARPRLAKGIPELNLPPLEPLFISSLENTEGSGRNQFRQLLSNLSIHGLGSFEVKDCRVPADLSHIYLEMTTPVVSFDGHYEISGRVLALPIQGNGNCKFTFNKVRTIADVPMNRVQRDGEEYLHAEDFRWTIEAESGSVHFDNLFNGDQKLSETMNNFLNENWKEAFEAYKHLPEEALGSLFTQFFNRVYDRFPAKSLFLE